jgi:hypothetical protein
VSLIDETLIGVRERWLGNVMADDKFCKMALPKPLRQCTLCGLKGRNKEGRVAEKSMIF